MIMISIITIIVIIFAVRVAVSQSGCRSTLQCHKVATLPGAMLKVVSASL